MTINDSKKILCCGSAPKSDQNGSNAGQEIDNESREQFIKEPGVVKIYRDVNKVTSELLISQTAIFSCKKK